MNADYLIVGQGISGTLLSYNLLHAGKAVMVIDNSDTATASRVASGIINPVTGKRLVKTWMIDDLLPFAHEAYTAMGKDLGVPLVRQCDILDFHLTHDNSTLFEEKQRAETTYLHRVTDREHWGGYFRFNYGVGRVAPVLLVDIRAMLAAWKKRLTAIGSLLEEQFSWAHCTVAQDHVVYKNITARKIILCNGAGGMDDPYFGNLPWSKDKGEALIVSVPGLPRDHIYRQGINIVPWEEDLFWVGATHDWKYTDMELTPAFRQQTAEHLNYWLKMQYNIVDHIVAQRPANLDRKPFVGLHPVHEAVGIFNGMGSKGCSVAPYFAAMFGHHLVHNKPLQPDVDVRRFRNVLSRA